MSILFRILGTTRLVIDGELNDRWEGKKERGLFAVLLMGAGDRPFTLDELARWLWDADSAAGRTRNLSQIAARVRTALANHDIPAELEGGIRAGTYSVVADLDSIDYHHVRNATETAATAFDEGAYLDALHAMDTALALWQGLPLADVGTERAEQFRVQTAHQTELRARCLRIDCRLALGHFDEALSELDGPLADDELNPLLAERRMRAMHGLGLDPAEFVLPYRAKYEAKTGSPAPKSVEDVYRELTAPASPVPLPRKDPVVKPDQEPVPMAQLPADPWSFYGRGQLLVELTAAAKKNAGVIVMHGAAGIGKTTMVARWARPIKKKIAARLLFVDLFGYSGTAPRGFDEVITELLTQLSPAAERISSSKQRVTRLRQILEQRRTLVVLDNARDSKQVRPLLPVLSECLVIITSRKRMTSLTAQHGARSLEVGPLDRDVITQWLEEELRGRRIHEPRAVRQLAEICGGSPYVTRIVAQLATSRQHQSLSGLVDELQYSRRGVLRLGSADDADATIYAALNCSYQVLAEDQKTVLRLLGCYPGRTPELGAVAALTSWSAERTADALEALTEVHLADHTDSERFELHDLTRDFAAELARSDNTSRAARRRLANWALYSVREAHRVVFPSRLDLPLEGFPQLVEPRRFRDHADAIAWCAQLREDLLAVAMDAQSAGLHGESWRIGNGTWEILRLRGFLAEARSLLNTALESARESGEEAGIIGTLLNLGVCRMRQREFADARGLLQEVTRLSGPTVDPSLAYSALHNLAACEMEDGSLRSALETYQQAFMRAVDMGNDYYRAGTLRRIAETLRKLGELDESLTKATIAAAEFQRLADRAGHGGALVELAEIFYARGMLPQAQSTAHQAMAVLKSSDDVETHAVAEKLLARIAVDTGNYREAVRYATRAQERYLWLHDADGEADVLNLLDRAHEHLSDQVVAAEECDRARENRADLEADSNY